MGSSRDWAAKGPALLGVRAILAVSFERIHRSNLINMGILPLLLPRGLVLRPGDRLRVEADADRLVPHAPILCAVLRLDGGVEAVDTVAAIETASEVETLICGGMLPRIGRRHLPETAVC
jgi:aconitate hydratase